MRLATSTNIVVNRPGGRKTTVPDAVELCAAAGYRVLDINFCDAVAFAEPFVGDAWEAWVRTVRRRAESAGVALNQAHSTFYNVCDAEIQDRAARDERMRRCVRACGMLGIPWLVVHAGTDPEDYDRSLWKNIDYYGKIVALAASCGVGIAFENLWDLDIAPRRRYTTRTGELMALVESFGAANVGVCLDEEHAMIMGYDIEKVIGSIGTRLKALHVSDYRSASVNHILPFDGVTDWVAVMGALRGCGYDGDLTYEIHNYAARYPDALLPQALRHSIAVGEYLLTL